MPPVTENPHNPDKNEQVVSKPVNSIDYNQASNSGRINELPVEILARIFVLGEGMLRGLRASGLAYVGFQDLVTQVCSRWRDVAIKTPTLWTCIFISRPPPHLRAECYIGRSGSCPLVIDIDMTARGIEPGIRLDSQLQAKRVLEAFEFIAGCGGTLERWRSLIITLKQAPVIFDIISFIGKMSAPNLKFLSLTRKTTPFSVRWYDVREQEAMDDAQGHAKDSDPYSLVHSPMRPQLRHVQLSGLPSDFIFNRSAPKFSHLTSFEFSHLMRGACPTIQGFSTLLSANPHLESLRLDIRGKSSDYSASTSLAPLQVRLPLLRSLWLGCMEDYEWPLQILQITDAPALEYFKLLMPSPYLATGQYPGKLSRYLSKGRLNGDLQCMVPPEQPTSSYSSIFPSLCHLDIAEMSGHFSSTVSLLEAFPLVTHVTFDRIGLEALYMRPELIPKASHFTYNARYTGSSTSALRRGVFRRVNAGLRVPFLEIITKERELLLDEIKNEVGSTGEDRIPPLRELVDKIEVREQEPIHVPTPDSDDIDDQSSSSEVDIDLDDADLEETDEWE